jgi:DNA end-binding protein Ku
MARAVWTGTVTFGLVNIPVSLYPATEPKDVRFHLYDRETGRRIRYRRVVDAGAGHVDRPADEPSDVPPQRGAEEAEGSAPPEHTEDIPAARPAMDRPGLERETASEVDVAFQDLMRGVEIEPGRAVVLDPEDIERARPQRSRTIEVEEFVSLADVDPVYFDKSYYVVPRRDEAATKPYTLLVRALERSERAGIGRFVLRTKPHLVVIRPVNGALGLETLFFGDEVRSPAEWMRGLDGIEVQERELELATGLIDMLATTWDPDRHADDYREELLRIIAEKTPMAVVRHDPDDDPEGSRLPDLMEALKASVDAVTRERAAGDSEGRRSAR